MLAGDGDKCEIWGEGLLRPGEGTLRTLLMVTPFSSHCYFVFFMLHLPLIGVSQGRELGGSFMDPA